MKFSRNIIIRLDRLFDMYYRPSELAHEIGCHVDTVYRSYIPAGCPHKRDDGGHIWIVGTEFAQWVRTNTSRNHIKMADDEAFCFKCNKPVKLTGDLTVKPTNKYLELVTGECPECGTTINRARARHNSQEEHTK